MEGERWIKIRARVRSDGITLAAGHQTARGGTVQFSTVSAHYSGSAWGATGLVTRAGALTNWGVAANAALGGGEAFGCIGRTGGDNAYGQSYGYGVPVAAAPRLRRARGGGVEGLHPRLSAFGSWWRGNSASQTGRVPGVLCFSLQKSARGRK